MHRYTILIVDDDRLLQKALNNILRERYDPVIAGSGEEALRLLDKQTVDLALLDVRLPGIDGVETLRRIKAVAPETPAVMVSSSEDLETARATLTMGASDYVAKPVDFAYLDSVLETHLLS